MLKTWSKIFPTAALAFMLCLAGLAMSGEAQALYGDDSKDSSAPTASTSAVGSYALIYNGPASAEDAPEAVAAIAAQVGLPVRYIADLSELPRSKPGSVRQCANAEKQSPACLGQTPNAPP